MPFGPQDPAAGRAWPDPADAAGWLAESPAALLTLDPAGRVRWANAACAELVGPLVAGQLLAEQLGLDAETGRQLDAALAGGGRVQVRRTGAATGAVHLRLDLKRSSRGDCLASLVGTDDEQAARREARDLAELMDLARSMGRLGIWERNVRTGEGRWDREVFRMRGMHGQGPSPHFHEAIGTAIEADRAGLEAAFRQSLRQAGTYAHHYRVLGLDGRVRLLHSQWIVKNGADGRPEHVTGLIMDDTQAWELARSHDELGSQLSLAADLAGIVIWRHDLASRRVYYNTQGFALMRMTPQADGLPIEQVRALVHPDDLAQVLASADASLRSEAPIEYEARYRRSDGIYLAMLTRRVVQRDADGQPTGFIGVALDVTERQETQRRASELGRRFELVTRTAGIGYWSLEDGAERARWSDELRQMHGLPASAPVPTQREWLDRHVHGEDRRDVRQRFAAWVAGGSSGLEADFRIVRSDGQVRHVITHSRVEGGGRHPLLFGLVIDVTERYRVELALRKAAERAALAARGAGIGTWEVDLLSGTVVWDEQMWRLRGLTPQAQPPTEDERLAWVHADDREAARRTNRDAALEPGVSYHEFRVVLADGSERWLASRSNAICDEAGNPVRRVGVNWDITDRRTAEAVRRERELAQLESQAKSKFLARMSHELRTPLNAVLGFAQLMLAEDPGDSDSLLSRRRRLEHVRAAGEHLLHLINDVMDLSSLEGGEVRIALEPVALAPLIEATLPLLEPQRREQDVEIVTGALDAVALADATRLRQVLLNLLSNAIKYNRRGGRVVIDTLQRGGNVLLRVTDTGRGLTDQQMLHLFEPFNRLGIEHEGIEGTGIGLAIVKALVERMGGSVHVDSTLGEGSRFELRLADASGRPARAPGPPAAGLRPAPRAAAGAAPSGTLLYIEDNPVNAQIIAELIARRADLRLHIADDGLSGVAKALALKPDLVLLDMQLPDIDGHEVLRRLRSQPATAAIPVIALSANAMPDDIDRALRAGMSDYWTKPLDFGAFMASIEVLFGPG